ncbi:MAG TPA: hypothetical protein VER55_10265 [Ardenticatenaceae bacterium]|nr:hypothetical protein [Ardenticatenaceae bacterium]
MSEGTKQLLAAARLFGLALMVGGGTGMLAAFVLTGGFSQTIPQLLRFLPFSLGAFIAAAGYFLIPRRVRLGISLVFLGAGLVWVSVVAILYETWTLLAQRV